MPFNRLSFLALFLILAGVFGTVWQNEAQGDELRDERGERLRINSSVSEAFRRSHKGYSSDEVLLQDSLRSAFLSELKALGVDIPESDALLTLLKLRKSGKLLPKSTRRGERVDDSVTPVAEIATRVVTDRHRVSADTMLASPELRIELIFEARKLSPAIDGYAVRKAALQLRKKRALRPELVLRVADWDREISTHSITDLRKQLAAKQISKGPGVYLFRHAADGYLYIGEAANLSVRLSEHLGGSDRILLAEFLSEKDESSVSVELHKFPSDSPAKRVSVRRAYESELIRSRNPKFNVRP